VKNLKNGVLINLLGMGSTLLGLQATVGVLVAKALTSSSTPYLQGAPAGFSPVLALDVFLVQVTSIRINNLHNYSRPRHFLSVTLIRLQLLMKVPSVFVQIRFSHLRIVVWQASANAILSHFLGLVFSLELLRSVTLTQPPPENVIPKPA
jgi:hypothetical protein